MAKQQITIITAAQGGGKTQAMQILAKDYQTTGKVIGGFVAPGTWVNGHRQSFEIVDLQSLKHYPFASRKAQENWTFIHSFYFNPQTIKKGEELLIRQSRDSEVLFIDEIGKFDIKGKLWGPVLWKLLKKGPDLVLCVRDVFLEDVVKHFGIEAPVILRY